jgi:hypothetical protein
VDRFHAQNTYLIAVAGERLVGMMAAREQRPFSLDEKLSDLDRYLPPRRKLCEIRLLSVVPAYRNGRVFQGLLTLLLEYASQRHCDLALISGTVRQLNLYHRLGFIPFGPLVGPLKARYQPMYLDLLGSCLRDVDFRRLRPFGASAWTASPGWTLQALADPGHDYVLLLTPGQSTARKAAAGARMPEDSDRAPARLELDLPPGHYGVDWLEPVCGGNLARQRHQHAGGVLTLTAPTVTGRLAVRIKRAPDPRSSNLLEQRDAREGGMP